MTEETIEKEAYIFATGDLAAKRLDHQHELNKKQSYEHVAKANLSEGKIVWDIGCGSGAMTEYFAKQVGSAGHVYAMDLNANQLAVARAKISDVGFYNVDFIAGDISKEISLLYRSITQGFALAWD